MLLNHKLLTVKQQVERFYPLSILLVLLLSGFNLFCNLGEIPIDSWDEARHGVSAYEMLKSNEFIINTYAYQADYWNLKPPLSFWLISLGYKVFGFNPLGLRFYSAAAAFLTILIIALFVKYQHGKLASLISTTALATTTQYVLYHGARRGDADSLYVFFFTLSLVSIMLMDINIKWLYVSGLAFSLAFLTKSWHAGNILVILTLYLFLSGAFRKLTMGQWIKFVVSGAALVITWGLLRVIKDGLLFFKTMISFDLLSRTSISLEGHVGGPSFYVGLFRVNYFYSLLVLVAAFTAFIALFSQDILRRKNYTLAIALWILVPLGLYTIAKTKIEWYILPVYPALAICIGAFTSKILTSEKSNRVLKLVIILLLSGTFYRNERVIISEIRFIPKDGAQLALKALDSRSKYQGRVIYTLCGNRGDPKHWNQSDLLAAELYGDLKAVDGGLETFYSSDNSLILIPKSIFPKENFQNIKLTTVIENETHFIFRKDD
jgi:4-amino-4-deoxy-L-arabinose transferase-like glycosyltransferase